MCERTLTHRLEAPSPMIALPMYTCITDVAKPRMTQPKAQQAAVRQITG